MLLPVQTIHNVNTSRYNFGELNVPPNHKRYPRAFGTALATRASPVIASHQLPEAYWYARDIFLRAGKALVLGAMLVQRACERSKRKHALGCPRAHSS